MKRQFIYLIVGGLTLSTGWSQALVTWQASASSPTETVETLWSMASAGELLSPEGWQSASGLFTKPLPPPKLHIRVVSNIWGPPSLPRKIAGHDTVIVVGCRDLGTIDPSLRFTPAPKTDAIKEGEVYRLVFAPTHLRTLEKGKLVQGEATGQPTTWQILDPLDTPFTTVNSAIRYVSEKRARTLDPVVRENAHQTLVTLFRLH
jgi:hypothetical protein